MKKTENILQLLELNRRVGRKSISILIDPDKTAHLDLTISIANEYGVDLFFVGGSLITSDKLSKTIQRIKLNSEIPVLLFPGSNLHIDSQADGILLLSLISGRNPDFLIGQHVIAAPVLKRTSLEILSVGYMLIDGGKQTAASYISNTMPIPANKPEIATSTAIAGNMLGLKLIYLDAGSGAESPVPQRMINMVSNSIDCPLLVGGGIKNIEQAKTSWNAGAGVLVVGNILENEPGLLSGFISARDELNSRLSIGHRI